MKICVVFLIFVITAVNTPTVAAEILPNRSLAVTEVDIMAEFSFEDVLTQLINLNNSQLLQTPLELFHAWAQTNTNCSELNGFPLICRENDFLADQLPFEPDTFAYRARGAFNRFDLASADGSDCGEYRLVFSRDHRASGQEKTLIFEARLPNIHPQQGLNGCAPIARFWAELSTIDNNQQRALALHNFYFKGIAGFPPVIHPHHFQRLPGSGQIRTNSFLSNGEWTLREYALRNECDSDCKLVFIPQPTMDNPFVPLASSATPNAFQDWFIQFITTPGAGLLNANINTLSFPVPTQFNAAEALLTQHFGQSIPINNISDSAAPQFKTRIQQQLEAMGSELTATQLLNRANVTTCNGCHSTAVMDDIGMTQPLPLVSQFRHLQMRLDGLDAPDGDRYLMSTALKQAFLPFRKNHLESFLDNLRPMTASLEIVSQWYTGFCAQIQVVNTDNITSSWRITLHAEDATIDNAWGATFAEDENELVLTPPTWAPTLASGEKAIVGYCASKTGSHWMPQVLSTTI